MANLIRDLAAELATTACQILEFQRATRSLPHVNIASLASQTRYESRVETEPAAITLHISRSYYDHKREYVDRGLDGQIDAVRAWAHRLGADLHLDDERIDPSGEFASRRLTADAVLPNGLGVHLYASLSYPVATEHHNQPAEALAA